MVIISKPVKIKSEYRFFIINNKVVGGSKYKFLGQLYQSNIIEPEVSDYVKNIVNTKLNSFYPVYVLDICVINNEFKIIEINCINGSGFYENDVEKIIIKLSELASKEFSN